MLVVIAIIALLAGLLVPALASALEKGRRAKCVSNLHQIGLSVSMYADDNGGLMPPFFGGTIVTNGGGNGIHLKIHTSSHWAKDVNMGPLNNVAVMVCPSDRAPKAITTVDYSGNNLTVYTSYAFNYELWLTGTPIQSVPQSTTLLAMDGDDTLNLQTGVWYGNINPTKKKQDVDKFNASIVTRRHTSRFNAVFIDGHVEWQKQLAYDSLLPTWQ